MLYEKNFNGETTCTQLNIYSRFLTRFKKILEKHK